MLDHLRELVVKPANESGGYGLLIGDRRQPDRTGRRGCGHRGRPAQLGGPAHPLALDRADALRRRSSSPATSTCGPSSCPARTSYVTAGGLTRVALREGSLVVNSSQGGGSKDTWVVETSGRLMLLSRVAENLYWAARYLERAEDTARIIRSYTERDAWTCRCPWARRGNRCSPSPAADRRSTSRTSAPDEEAIVRFLVADEPTRQRRHGHQPGPREPAAPRARSCPATAGRSSTTSTCTSPADRYDAVGRRSRGAVPGARPRPTCQRLDGILAATMSRDDAYGSCASARPSSAPT